MAIEIDAIREGLERCPVTGLMITTSPQWCDLELTPEYRVSFYLIGEQVLLVIPRGNSRQEGVKRLFKARAGFMEEFGLSGKSYVEIKDYSLIRGHISREARQQSVKNLIDDHYLKGFLTLNCSLTIKIAFTVAKRLYRPPFTLMLLNSYEKAIKNALSLLKESPVKETLSRELESQPADIEQLFQFISSSGWELKKRAESPDIDESHPFKPLYDSFSLVKQDFNDVLERYKRADSFNILRAEIWKLAADETLSEEELIKKMLNMTGPLLGGSRFCYSRFSGEDPSKSDLITLYEWHQEGVSSTLGEKIPAIIVKNFINKGVIELNIKSAIALTPAPLKPMMKPLFTALAKSQNLESVFIFPYYHDGRLHGWFTVDICRNEEEVASLDEDARSIVHDIVSILSSHIEKRKAQEELKRAYKEMESQVAARTKELRLKNSMLEERDVELLEKNSVLQTSLDILSHDTKNLFFNIQILIKQLNETQIKRLIEDGIKELFEITMEAAGIMGAKKRIFSLVETIEKLRVTGDRIAIGKHHRLNLLYNNPNLLFVETSSLFKNAVSNLVENALKYSPEEEVVEIVLDYVGEDIHIQVRDRGAGVPDCEKSRIFEKFYRIEAHKAIGGTGRGLWITRNIIRKEGGSLLITDNPGGGAIFTISIPAFRVDNMEERLAELAIWFELSLDKVKQKANSVRTMLIMNESNLEGLDTMVFTTLLTHLREESRQKSMESVIAKLKQFKKKNPGGKGVVIADDSIFIHYHLAGFFTERGMRVAELAKNGEEAVYFYKKCSPALITLDKTMPLKSGLEAAREIVKYDKGAKILFITALGDMSEFREEAAKIVLQGNYAIVSKPIKEDELNAALQELLG